MKTDISKKTILDAIKQAKLSMNRKSSNTTLNNLAIVTDDLGVRLQSTNLDVSFEKSLAVVLDFKPSVYLIEPKELKELIECIDAGIIEFAQTENGLEIGFKDLKKTLTDQSESWPKIDFLSSALKESINIMGLKDVSLAMSDDPTRFHLNGVYFDAKGFLVATDGHRLHKSVSTTFKTSFIMPDKAVKLCINQDHIEVQHDNNKHYITLNASTRLVIKNIESKYPNWQQFVPQSFKHEIDGNTKDFTSLIKKAEKLADKKSKSIAFDESKLRVNPDLTLDLGKIKNTMPDGKTFNPKIGINASYLLDALTCVDQDNVSIKMNDPLSPVRITSQAFEAVIMPMRV
jgi:DNA polymerase-3 subunit beta